MPILPSSGLCTTDRKYSQTLELHPLHFFWPVPASTFPKSTRAQFTGKTQKTAFPTDNLSAAQVPKGTRVVRIDAGQLADSTAGLTAI